MTNRYFPHTPEDVREMLGVIGVGDIEDLFASIPAESRLESLPAVPGPLGEYELGRRLEGLAATAGGDWSVFLGAGSQEHHIPALVPALSGRSEFLTSYTPYQPEISQGTLQAVFEFQTLIARLTGLPVANASLYDGATALAEAALMARRVTGRRRLLVSSLVHPHWREVLATYLAPDPEAEVTLLPPGPDGLTALADTGVGEAAALIIQSPNFFGAVEDVARAAEIAHAAGALLLVGFSEPFALGVLKSPGSLGADIAFGEGQSLGLPQSFGGPGLGLLSSRQEFVRQIPGRLVGEAKDLEGKRGFVLTLATREQHIRRSKAVSNICTNAGHSALTAAIFMAAAGGSGFRQLAQANHDLAEYLKSGLLAAGFTPLGGGKAPVTFNEFVLRAPAGFSARHAELCRRKILAGLALSPYYPALSDAWLFGVTETKSREDIDQLLREVKA
ncbi:MAG: aminomethyl-transferring glycine dehydrogenase subunit GcvPA [Planctomycetota bacterium]|jgi:glycine dehydrogenase subunit 1|nr:aminomethyl-transferring glycine dehydrogenase subunit GcvPA [Planctomycetota bacterium]